jgi:hypothetical protein
MIINKILRSLVVYVLSLLVTSMADNARNEHSVPIRPVFSYSILLSRFYFECPAF